MVKILGANKKKNLTFQIHEGATIAFEFFISMERLFNIEKLSTSSTEFFSKSMTLHAIENNSSIQIISGFEHAAFDLTKTDFSSINILIYPPSLPGNEISELAWSGVIEKIHSSIDRKSLGQFMIQSKEKFPIYIMRTLYDSNDLSGDKLAELTSVSRGTIFNQKAVINKINEANKAISKDGILNEMRAELFLSKA